MLIEGSVQRYHLLAAAQAYLGQDALPEVRFLAPLDSLMWDRKMIAEIFGFDYIWEVYKPQPLRRWGYYVLPVLYGDLFVGRMDSRLTGGTWHILNWWWEEGVTVTPDLIAALGEAVTRFRRYLGAERIELPVGLDVRVQAAFHKHP